MILHKHSGPRSVSDPWPRFCTLWILWVLFYQEQFGSSWTGGMGIPRPMGGPPSSAPPQSSVSTTATSTASSVMLQPRVPGSPSSIRMSPTARQEYDAYMQSRLRMAAQSPRPRAPTTIQLGVSDWRCHLFYRENCTGHRYFKVGLVCFPCHAGFWCSVATTFVQYLYCGQLL